MPLNSDVLIIIILKQKNKNIKTTNFIVHGVFLNSEVIKPI